MRDDLLISTRKDSTFYGDIFKIGNEGCLFFGFGKSNAGYSAIENDSGTNVALDFACITRDQNVSYGHFELGVYSKHIPDPINSRISLTCFVRFLSEDETLQLFPKGTKNILVTDYDTFVKASAFNILFSGTSMESFIFLTKNSSVNKFLFVPWMDSHVQKGEMLRDYILTMET